MPPSPWAGVPAEDFGDDDVTVTVDTLASGSFFGDRFRVEGSLGVGGMGRVVHAHDFTTGLDVALKVLHRERAQDVESLERFRREAQILQALGHSGIVRILAMGAAPDGTPWIALELLRGETLKERLRREGPFSVAALAPIVAQLCDALTTAHDAGVVHRDLKPDNVLLPDGGAPPCKVLDFGLSRFTASKTLTKAGAVLGTPRYMAPEQILSASSADLRVDVFAVGVMLFEMLSGRSPYPAEDMGQLLGCVMEGRVLSLAELRPDISPAVAAVVAQAMARDAERRYPTAAALGQAFARAVGAPLGPPGSVGARPPSRPTPTPGRGVPVPDVLRSAPAPGRIPERSPAARNSAPSSPAPRAGRAAAIFVSFVLALTVVVVVAALFGAGLRFALEGRLPWSP